MSEEVTIGDGITLKREAGHPYRAWVVTDGNECSVVGITDQPLHRYLFELYESLAEE